MSPGQARCASDRAVRRVTATDRQLAALDRLADLDLEDGPDRVAIRSRLAERQTQPMAHRDRVTARAGPDVAPQPHGRIEVDLDQVEEAVGVEVGQRGSAAPFEIDDARRLGGVA